MPGEAGQQWGPLVVITGDDAAVPGAYRHHDQGKRRPVPHVRRRQSELDPLLPARGPRERPQRPRDHLRRDVGADQQVLPDGPRRRHARRRARRSVRLLRAGERLGPAVLGRHRRHDVARRGLALLPAGPDDGAGRQDVADPRREVFHPAAQADRRGHAVRRRPVAGAVAIGQRAGDVSPAAWADFAGERGEVPGARPRSFRGPCSTA